MSKECIKRGEAARMELAAALEKEGASGVRAEILAALAPGGGGVIESAPPARPGPPGARVD